MEEQMGALGLVMNAITLWNTVYLDAAIAQLRSDDGYPVLDSEVRRLSPYMRRHINVHGHNQFTQREAENNLRNLRDLRDPQAPDYE